MVLGTSSGSGVEQGPEVGGPEHDSGVDRVVRRGKRGGHGRAKLRNRFRCEKQV